MSDFMASLCRRRSGDFFLRDVMQLFDDNAALILGQRGGIFAAAEEGRAGDLEAMLEGLRSFLQNKPEKAAERIKRKVVNQRDAQEQTPLMLACRAGALGCVRLLLEAGANATLVDGLQSTCLHEAARQGSGEVLELLLGDDSWVETANGGRVLLRNAFIIDTQGHHRRFIDGQSCEILAPLHLAAVRGHESAAKALIKRGAALSVRCSVFSEDEGSWPPFSTPLHLAAANGHARVVLALLRGWVRQPAESRGPDLRSLEDFRGRIPLDVARSAGQANLLRVLNPDLPIQQVLRPPPTTIPSLASLAAEALRQWLVAQLEEIGSQAEVAPQAQHGAREGLQPGPSTPQQPQLQQAEAAPTLAVAAAAAAAQGASVAEAQREPGASHGAWLAPGAGGSDLRGIPEEEPAPATPLGVPALTTLAREPGEPGPATPRQEAAAEGEAGAAGPSSQAQHGAEAIGEVQMHEEGEPLPPTPPGSSQQLGPPRPPGLPSPGLPTPGPRLPSLGLSPGSSPACAVCLGRDSGSRGSLSRHSAGSSTHSGTGASSQDSAATCPICFDRWGRPRMVTAVWCGHRVCLACAQHICQEARRGSAVRCPLCRAVVGNWAVAPPRGAGRESGPAQ